MSIRLIPAPLDLMFSPCEENEAYEREYQQLSGADDDAIGQWLKIAKARGDTQETDSVLLQLIVELHRKIDNLERLINSIHDEISIHNICITNHCQSTIFSGTL